MKCTQALTKPLRNRPLEHEPRSVVWVTCYACTSLVICNDIIVKFASPWLFSDTFHLQLCYLNIKMENPESNLNIQNHQFCWLLQIRRMVNKALNSVNSYTKVLEFINHYNFYIFKIDVVDHIWTLKVIVNNIIQQNLVDGQWITTLWYY